MWFCAWMIIGGKQSPLGNIATYQPRIWIHKYSPLQKLCVTPLWRRNREDNIELANYGVFERGLQIAKILGLSNDRDRIHIL